MPQIQRSSKTSNTQHPKPAGSVTPKQPPSHNAPTQTQAHTEARVERVKGPKANPSSHVESWVHKSSVDPSEPPDYDFSKDRGRKIRLRQEEQCVFNHSSAENSPLLDLKQWREKTKSPPRNAQTTKVHLSPSWKGVSHEKT